MVLWARTAQRTLTNAGLAGESKCAACRRKNQRRCTHRCHGFAAKQTQKLAVERSALQYAFVTAIGPIVNAVPFS